MGLSSTPCLLSLSRQGLNGGDQTHTAEQLRIGSATLYRKLKSYGLIGGKRAVRKGASTRSRVVFLFRIVARPRLPRPRTERVARRAARSFACCNIGQRLAQLTFTWMFFGFASGFFGRWMRSTPCFDSARIFSASMLAGSEKARVNVP